MGQILSTDAVWGYLDGLVQDCCNSIANAMELLQSCTKPFILKKTPPFFQPDNKGVYIVQLFIVIKLFHHTRLVIIKDK